MKKFKVASFFSGAGGLDLGFEKAGFKIIYANDNDKDILETYEKNHSVEMDTRSIVEIPSDEIPEADGIIGGPPCQSWSLAGAMRGSKDARGQLFFEYVRVIRDKKPKFFLAENVPGIISKSHIGEFKKLLSELGKLGYNVTYKLLNAHDFGVPQERKRVIIVGIRQDLNVVFDFPTPSEKHPCLKEAIGDLPEPRPAKEKNHANGSLKVANNEYMNGGFSTMYMSRNRRKKWNEPSFTIQAGGRHAPLHPTSPEMKKVEKDKWVFVGDENKVRRLSVRECARIQTFPDSFKFYYDNVGKGYKLIGNAVPVNLAFAIAKQIKGVLSGKIVVSSEREVPLEQLKEVSRDAAAQSQS